MSQKLNLGWLGAVAMGVVLSAAAQEKPADFTTQVPLSVTGEGPWYRLELPLNVQLNARQADLSDLRVFNAVGDVQAYALARESAQSSETRTLNEVKRFALYNSVDATETAPSVRVQSSANGTLVEVQPSSQLEAGEQELRGWLLDASAIKGAIAAVDSRLDQRARRLPAFHSRSQRRFAALAVLGRRAGGAPDLFRRAGRTA